jgi:hypothetical protein
MLTILGLIVIAAAARLWMVFSDVLREVPDHNEHFLFF